MANSLRGGGVKTGMVGYPVTTWEGTERWGHEIKREIDS